jgi:hypothetical protein
LENKQLSEKLREVERKVNQLESTNSSLRSTIFNNTGKQEVPDEEIGAKFSGLRNRIHTIARSNLFSMTLEKPLFKKETDMVKFYEAWGKLSLEKDRRTRIKAQIFDILHRHILDDTCFGLNGLSEEFSHIESGLASFEYAMEGYRNQVGSDTIANWRIATLNCIEKLKFEEKTSKGVADYIYKFFEPLIPKGAKQNERNTLFSNIVALCKDAFTLRIAMRKSKGNYKCEVLPYGRSLSMNEDIAMNIGVEGGENNEASDVIMFTLFGALTKNFEGTKRVVEHAYVILGAKK